MSREESPFDLSALARQHPPPPMVSLFALARQEKMLPLLAWHGQHPTTWPQAQQREWEQLAPALLQEAQQSLRQQRKAAMVRDMLLDKLDQRLGAQGIHGILYKGVAYERMLYPEPGLRPMADVDLLVPKGRYQEVQEILEVQGFQCVTRSSNEQCWRDPQTRLYLDLHDDVSTLHEATIALDDLFAAASPIATGSVLHVLPVAETFLLHLFHMRSHGLEPEHIPLVHFADLLSLWHLNRTSLASLLELARAWHTQSLLSMGLLCLEDIPLQDKAPTPASVSGLPGPLAALQARLMRRILWLIRMQVAEGGPAPVADVQDTQTKTPDPPADRASRARLEAGWKEETLWSIATSRSLRVLLRLCSHDSFQDLLRSNRRLLHRVMRSFKR